MATANTIEDEPCLSFDILDSKLNFAASDFCCLLGEGRLRSLVYAVFGAALCMSSVVDAQGNRQLNPFGVLSELDGTAWSLADQPQQVIQYKWKSRDEVLESLDIEGSSLVVAEYRLGLDGQSISVESRTNTGKWQISFPSPDSWALIDARNDVVMGCRLKSDRKSMMCEYIEQDGKRHHYELIKVPLTTFESALASLRQNNDKRAQDQDAARKKEASVWGAWADVALVFDDAGKSWWEPREFRALAGKPGEKSYEAIVQVAWKKEADGALSMSESVASPGLKFYGWWYWKTDRTGVMQRRYAGRDDPNSFVRGEDGNLSGRYHSFAGTKKVSFRKTPEGLEMVSLDKAGQVTWRQTLTEVSKGTYRRTYDSIIATEKVRKSGSGFLESLAGGLAEVAAAANPAYNPYVGLTGGPIENPLDENSAQNRQFRENIARIAAGRPTAATVPSASSRPASPAAVPGRPAASALKANPSGNATNATPRMIAVPIRFMLSAGVQKAMGPKGNEVQGRCFSNVLTIPGPPAPDGNVNAFGMLEKYYDAVEPYVQRFKILCSKVGTLSGHDLVWSVDGDNPDAEYSDNAARGVYYEVRL